MNVASLSAILKSAFRFPVWNADADALIAPDGSEVPLGGGSWDGVLAKGTITTDQKVMDLSVTWNNAAVTFTGLKFNVTNTASNAASLLMDLQVGGVSKFSFTKSTFKIGSFTTAAALASNSGAQWVVGSAGVGYRISLEDQGTATGLVAWSAGTPTIMIDYTGATIQGTSGALMFGATVTTPDTYLRRDAANTLALRNSTNAQTFNIYNTYTDASNYERLGISWSGNVISIKPVAAGTGTVRELHISGLPTANPGPGILWNNAGTPAIGT